PACVVRIRSWLRCIARSLSRRGVHLRPLPALAASFCSPEHTDHIRAQHGVDAALIGFAALGPGFRRGDPPRASILLDQSRSKGYKSGTLTRPPLGRPLHFSPFFLPPS